MSRTVLLVDPDRDVLAAAGRYLENLGYDVRSETTGRGGVQAFRTARPDVVVLALELPDAPGLDILGQIRSRGAEVVMITEPDDTASAVRALQVGAENFVTRPVELPHLGAVVARAAEKSRLRRENLALKANRNGQTPGQVEALGVSSMMTEIGRQVRLLADQDPLPVLLTGESGTGKGCVARLLHRLGPRADRPFVETHGAGPGSTSLASDLFGYEEGAFTGAREPRAGLLESAHAGVLFLDEVAGLDPDLQARLLNLLEDGTFRRLGGTRDLTVDVRLVAASSRDLEAAVEAGDFRRDLLRRLEPARLHLPPLRDRTPEDRTVLLRRLNQEVRAEMGRDPGEISDGALEVLITYAWPGNIREMRNVLERAAIFGADSDEILTEHLPIELRRSKRRASGRSFRPDSLEEVERRHIERMLRHHDGNRTHAARDLGIARATLINKIKVYNLDL